jgi:hypothetical protein
MCDDELSGLDGGRRVLSATGMLAVRIQHEFEHARGEPGRASARSSGRIDWVDGH